MSPTSSPRASGSIQLSLHEHACLRAELIWIYDHTPGKLSETVDRMRDRGNWAWFLRRGKLTLKTADAARHLRPGDWLMLPEGTTTHSFSADARLLSVHFRCQWPSGENLLVAPDGLQIKGALHPGLERKAVRLEKCLRGYFPDVPSHHVYQRQVTGYTQFLRLQTLFLTWLEEWVDACAGHGANWSRLRQGDDRLLRVVRLLNESPLVDGFPGPLVVKKTGLGMVQLNRLFVREFGLTTRKYWERRLFQVAQDSLIDPALPVKELAYRLGFRSDSLFVNWFRRRSGTSPGRFREEPGFRV